MDRRGFLKGLAAVVGGVALEEAIPFGRVWSFPKEIVRPALTFDRIPVTLKFHRDAFAMASASFEWDDYERLVTIEIGSNLPIRIPPRFILHPEGMYERLYEPPNELQEAYKRGVIGEILSLPSAS